MKWYTVLNLNKGKTPFYDKSESLTYVKIMDVIYFYIRMILKCPMNFQKI